MPVPSLPALLAMPLAAALAISTSVAATETSVPTSSSGPSLKGQLFLTPGVEEFRLLVKFRPDAPVPGTGPFALPKSSAAGRVRFNRAVPFTPEESARLAQPATLRKPAAGAFDILAFAGLYYADSISGGKEALLDYALRLEARDDVEYCVLEPRDPPEPPLDIAPPTPSYVSRQTYLGPNPGVDCKYAWSQGIKGKGVRISDVEFDWNLDHEDLADQDIEFGLERKSSQYRNHGTAVVGVLASGHNNYGMDGCAPEAVIRLYPEGHGRSAAILRASADSKPGDILLLEMQVNGPDGKLAPADVNTAVWDAVRKATEAGIIVVAAAGNGAADLGSASYNAYRNRGDNGSIIVGAGTPNTLHDRLNFSTFGARVTLQGWGSGVATLDYGSLKPGGADVNQYYSTSFSGTSSASPVVTSAVALVQSYARQKLSRSLTPKEMRDLLVSTGTRQGPATGLIGPLPNIRAAIEKLSGPVGVTRTSPDPSSLRVLARPGRLLLEFPFTGKASTQILDAAGKVLLTRELSFSPEQSTQSLETAKLNAGIHYLHLTIGETRISNRFAITTP